MLDIRAQVIADLKDNSSFLHEFSQRATSLGISMVPNTLEPIVTKLIRSSLIPKCFRRSLYDKVVELNPLFNRLIDKISLDLDYLVQIHSGTLR